MDDDSGLLLDACKHILGDIRVVAQQVAAHDHDLRRELWTQPHKVEETRAQQPAANRFILYVVTHLKRE